MTRAIRKGAVRIARARMGVDLRRSAQTWPSRPITLIVPFAAGGALDLPARRLAAEIGPKLGQQIVIENRTGANGNIGAAAVAKADPDGYTLLFGSPGVLVTNRFMYKSMPFDADRAFTPVALLAKSPLLIASSPKFPATNLKGLIEHAKANPGKVTVGTPGVGSQAHLIMELLAAADRHADDLCALSRRQQCHRRSRQRLDRPHRCLRAGAHRRREGWDRARAVVTTLERSKQLPEVPTIHEVRSAGFRGRRLVLRRGAGRHAARGGAKLNAAINDYLKSPAGQRAVRGARHADRSAARPSELRDYIATEVAKWGPIIKAAGIAM